MQLNLPLLADHEDLPRFADLDAADAFGHFGDIEADADHGPLPLRVLGQGIHVQRVLAGTGLAAQIEIERHATAQKSAEPVVARPWVDPARQPFAVIVVVTCPFRDPGHLRGPRLGAQRLRKALPGRHAGSRLPRRHPVKEKGIDGQLPGLGNGDRDRLVDVVAHGIDRGHQLVTFQSINRRIPEEIPGKQPHRQQRGQLYGNHTDQDFPAYRPMAEHFASPLSNVRHCSQRALSVHAR